MVLIKIGIFISLVLVEVGIFSEVRIKVSLEKSNYRKDNSIST